MMIIFLHTHKERVSSPSMYGIVETDSLSIINISASDKESDSRTEVGDAGNKAGNCDEYTEGTKSSDNTSNISDNAGDENY